jgi:peptidoglycan L-alanyl-D-glutamate endopeptidase CwlK
MNNYIAITLLAALTISTAWAGSTNKHRQDATSVTSTALPVELAQMNFKLLKPIKGVSRTFAELDADYRNRLISVFIVMKQQYGYDMVMLEGYRSPERQDSLSSNVTLAVGGQSFHQYGLASDCAFMKDGKLMSDPRNAWTMQGYKLLGQVASSVGLVWGGNWSIKDYGHTELRTQKAMYAMNMLRKAAYRNAVAAL